jgi:hypothetical protein
MLIKGIETPLKENESLVNPCVSNDRLGIIAGSESRENASLDDLELEGVVEDSKEDVPVSKLDLVLN